MTIHRGGAALFGVAAALGAGQAAAQDEPIKLDAIGVEAAAAQKLLGNADITEEEMEARNPTSLKDVFKAESGVQVTGGAAIAQKVVVQGIEETLLSVTIDGARQNKSAFHHTGNILIDPALLKRVEISAGLAPADAGPGAVAGAIAYETKDARDLLEDGETWGGIASVSAFSNGPEMRAGLTLFGQAEGFELLLSGQRAWGSDYRDGDGVVVQGTAPDTLALIGKLAYTTDEGLRFEASIDHTEDTGLRLMQAGPGGLLFARPDFAGVVGRESVLAEALSERRSYTFTFTDETPTAMWAPFAQLTYNSQRVEAGGAIGVNTSLSGTAKNDFRVLGGVLSAGVDFFRDTAEGDGPGTVGAAKETLLGLGLFAQMRHDVAEGVSLSYGLRLDGQSFELADGTTHEDAGVSANAAVDVALAEGLFLTAGAATVWGGYELSEASLINFFGEWDYGPVSTQRSYNGRVGLRYETGPFTFSGAVFRTQVEDVDFILSAARTPVVDVVSQGVTAGVGYEAETAFIRVNYTFADVTADGAPIGSTAYYVGRPAGHLFGAEAAWDVTPQWRIGGSLEAAAENGEYEPALPGYVTGDVYAEWRPTYVPGMTLRFEVRNVGDATYAARTSDGNGLSNVVVLNEPGRSFGLTLTQRF